MTICNSSSKSIPIIFAQYNMMFPAFAALLKANEGLSAQLLAIKGGCGVMLSLLLLNIAETSCLLEARACTISTLQICEKDLTDIFVQENA